MTKSTSKRNIFSVTPYFISYLLLPLLTAGALWKGVWLFAPQLFIFLFIPILDLIFSKDRQNNSLFEYSKFQLFILKLSPIGFLLGFSVNIFLFATKADQFTSFEFVTAVLSLGAVGSIAITAAHELLHKPSVLSRYLGRFGMMQFFYMQFEISHLNGHHKDMGKKEDNHTAWAGESIYSYLFRTVRDAFKFCWKFEVARLTKRGFKTFSLKNRIILFNVIQLSFAIIFLATFGPFALLLLFGQAIIAVVSLEAVSYIEHYGLMKKEIQNNTYERTSNFHSWNSYHRFSNYLTFMLQRHSGHHLTPSKRYFLLEANNESPELPLGYPLLILIVFVPRLWEKLIETEYK